MGGHAQNMRGHAQNTDGRLGTGDHQDLWSPVPSKALEPLLPRLVMLVAADGYVTLLCGQSLRLYAHGPLFVLNVVAPLLPRCQTTGAHMALDSIATANVAFRACAPPSTSPSQWRASRMISCPALQRVANAA